MHKKAEIGLHIFTNTTLTIKIMIVGLVLQRWVFITKSINSYSVPWLLFPIINGFSNV